MELILKKVKVIYICGEGRSGSTLLDRILGQADGLVSCGEMWLLWERGYKDNQLCGCGRAFNDCLFWSKVLNRMESEIGKAGLCDVASIQKKIMRMRYIPWLSASHLQPSWYRDRLKQFALIMKMFYSAVLEQSGAEIIVDSSKMPLYGLLLNGTGEFDLRVIHLVRNSNSVAYSWQRKRLRKEITKRVEYMPRYSVMSSAYNWMKINAVAELLAGLVEKSVRLRYEDFVEKPEATINDLLYQLGLHGRRVSGLRGNTVTLGGNHIPSGNPMRFKLGDITLKEDTEWKRNMPLNKRVLVSGMTLPLLMRYGYSIRVR